MDVAPISNPTDQLEVRASPPSSSATAAKSFDFYFFIALEGGVRGGVSSPKKFVPAYIGGPRGETAMAIALDPQFAVTCVRVCRDDLPPPKIGVTGPATKVVGGASPLSESFFAFQAALAFSALSFFF